MTPSRVIWLVMDSVGIGALPDAPRYGDQGSNTLGNIAQAVRLHLPALCALGLDRLVPGLAPRSASSSPLGAFGRMMEASAGKDSVTGHWEMTGLVLERPFPTFPHGFPAATIAEFERRIGRRSLGNTVASGTAIIDHLGPEHLRTGAPIVYTSADSVFQIAAHEDVVPVTELYAMCHAAFDIVATGLGVARVIARPFVGVPGHFIRTANRRDFALEPFGPTLLDHLTAVGQPVVGIGKIEDLFAGRGLTAAIHTTSDAHGMEVVTAELDRTHRGLIFANFVDFDTQYGHRNDVRGYAANLERFDAALGPLIERLRPADVLVVTADHGNDPTTPSTDHSREHVPVFLMGEAIRPASDVGTRTSFADLGQTVASLLGVAPLRYGVSFWPDIVRYTSAAHADHP
jgi:phosphopentomutase